MIHALKNSLIVLVISTITHITHAMTPEVYTALKKRIDAIPTERLIQILRDAQSPTPSSSQGATDNRQVSPHQEYPTEVINTLQPYQDHLETLTAKVNHLMTDLCATKKTSHREQFYKNIQQICQQIVQCFTVHYISEYPKPLHIFLAHIFEAFGTKIPESIAFFERYEFDEVNENISLEYRIRIMNDYWMLYLEERDIVIQNQQRAIALSQQPRARKRIKKYEPTVWDRLYTDGKNKNRLKLYGTTEL